MKNNKPQKPWNATCPICKTPKAYSGFNSNECLNHYCKNYSNKHENYVNEYTKKIKEYLDQINKKTIYNTNISGDFEVLKNDKGEDGFYISTSIAFNNLFDTSSSVDEGYYDNNFSDDSDQPIDEPIDFDDFPIP